jgi:hypothetical protein
VTESLANTAQAVDGGPGFEGVQDVMYGEGVGDEDFTGICVFEEVNEEFVERGRGVSDPGGREYQVGIHGVGGGRGRGSRGQCGQQCRQGWLGLGRYSRVCQVFQAISLGMVVVRVKEG